MKSTSFSAMGIRSTKLRTVALAALLLGVSGCASTTLDTFPSTAEIVDQGDLLGRTAVPAPSGFQKAANERIQTLVAEPLTLDAALEIAMLNNPAIQGVYQHQQVFTPGFVEKLVAARSQDAGSHDSAVEWTALRLALLKQANSNSRYRFADEYAEAVPEFVEVAEHVRKAYYTAVAALQAEAMMAQVVEALQAEAELANEQYRAGTASRGEQAKRHLAYSAALKEYGAAKRELVEAREALNRDLGLWGEGLVWTLPDRLPDLPEQAPRFEGLEDYALQNRLDLIEARRSGGAWQKAVGVRSEVREAYANLQAAYDAAKYQRDVVMPATQTALEFAQQEYNGMLIGVYDLLAEVREQIEAGKDYIESLRDYWIAEAELTGVVGGALPKQQSL